MDPRYDLNELIRLIKKNCFQNLFLKIQNGCVYHNNDVTLIELTMCNVKDVYTSDIHDVIMYLHYNSDETRPYKLYTSTNDIQVRSPSFHRRLNMYFMPFLRKDLSLAFMQIINSYVEFIWHKIMVVDEDNITVCEYEEKVYENEKDGYVEQFLCRRNGSERLKTSEGEMLFEISSDKDEMEINI